MIMMMWHAQYFHCFKSSHIKLHVKGAPFQSAMQDAMSLCNVFEQLLQVVPVILVCECEPGIISTIPLNNLAVLKQNSLSGDSVVTHFSSLSGGLDSNTHTHTHNTTP
jgi:hypothetical protein